MNYLLTNTNDIVNGTNDPDKVENGPQTSTTDHDIIKTFGGNDGIFNQSGSVDVDAGAGNDRIIVGIHRGVNIVDGGDGDDQIEVNAYGTFTSFDVRGGQGDDIFIFFDGANPTAVPIAFNGGTGDDTLRVPDFYSDVQTVSLKGFTINSVENLSLFHDISATGTILNLFKSVSGDFRTADPMRITLTDASLLLGKNFGSEDAVIASSSSVTNVDMTGATGDYRIRSGYVPKEAPIYYDETDHLTGGSGNDILDAGGGDDVLNGGGGDDVLIGGEGADAMNGGDGIDTVQYAIFDDFPEEVMIIDLLDPTRNTREAAGDTFVSIESVFGSAGTDWISGDNNANTLSGGYGQGADKLMGRGGDDLLIFQGGNVVLFDGGEGNDTLDVSGSLLPADLTTTFFFGTELVSIENLRGGDENDTLRGDGGDNRLTGLSGNDTLMGRGGADTLDGGDGVDTATYAGSTTAVRVDLQVNSVNIGTDALGDVLISIENITGTDFADSLRGDGANNELSGGTGNDTLNGRAGHDRLYGGDGDDLLIGGTGRDYLDGGLGNDTASYETAAAGVRADIANTFQNSRGDATQDGFISIENLTGSAFADSLRGDDGVNVLSGGSGNDFLAGRGGNDVLIGGRGADTLDGGAGSDTASYAASSVGVRADLQNSRQNSAGDATHDAYVSIENLTGSAFADSLRGDAGDNRIAGGAGDDYITGRTGNDVLYGGEGADRFQFFVDLDNTAIVMDYQKGLDRFDLVATIATDQTLQIISGVDGDLDGAADDALVDYGSGQFYIANGHTTGVSMGDFIFS